MADSQPKHRPGQALPCHANVALTGARFCAIVGEPVDGNERVGLPTGAGARVFGVVARDAAVGTKVPVHSAHGQIVPVEAGAGGLAAGQLVQSDANGTAIVRAAGIVCGECTTGAAAGAQAMIKFAPALL